jgi:nitrite reductase/ring-hydroxylating ferredoxin subunit
VAEIFVARVGEMQEGERRIVGAGAGHELGVFFVGGAFYCYSNYCAHSGGPACEGILIPKVEDILDESKKHRGQVFADEMHFVCPWHGYEYDLKTGECVGDRTLKLRKYEVIVREDKVMVVT